MSAEASNPFQEEIEYLHNKMRVALGLDRCFVQDSNAGSATVALRHHMQMVERAAEAYRSRMRGY